MRKIQLGDQIARVRQHQQPDEHRCNPDRSAGRGSYLRRDRPREQPEQQHEDGHHRKKNVPEHGPIERHAVDDGPEDHERNRIQIQADDPDEEEHMHQATRPVARQMLLDCALAAALGYDRQVAK